MRGDPTDNVSNSSSGVGVCSNPTAALALVAVLAAFRFVGEQIKEAIMSRKTKNSKFLFSVEKRRKPKLASIISHIFESIWAMGAGVAAVMVISTSAHTAGR